MEKAVGSESCVGKKIRDLLADASIAHIPFPKNGRDFGVRGWGTGISKLLIAKKNGAWCLYILETGLFGEASELRAKAWFVGLSEDEKTRYKQLAEGMAKWEKTHATNEEDTRKTKEAITKRTLQTRIVQHKGRLLASMKPNQSELDNAEVIKLFSLFDPNFDNIKNKPNDLNIYGDYDFVFLGDTYSCVAGKEALGFVEAVEICKRMIAGE